MTGNDDASPRDREGVTADGGVDGGSSAPGLHEPEAGSLANRFRAGVARVDDWVADLRADRARRRTALAIALVVGLAAGWVHWTGLVLGGAMVGLTRRGLGRAVLAGLGFGVLALAATVLAPGTVDVAAFGALAPVSYVAVALGLVLPAWGALVRGVV